MKVKPPAAPPPLKDMAARKEKLEAERARLFPLWRCALEGVRGNVTEAGEKHDPPLTRNQANKLTHRLGLVEYARQLRVKAVGKAMGTPKRR